MDTNNPCTAVWATILFVLVFEKAIHAFLKAVELNPFKIKHYYYFGLSLLGPEKFLRVKRRITNCVTFLGIKKPFEDPLKRWEN